MRVQRDVANSNDSLNEEDYCLKAIPMEWIEKVEGIDDVIEAAIKVGSSCYFYFFSFFTYLCPFS